MKHSAEAVLQDIKDIAESWICLSNGNYRNSKISATIYIKKDKSGWNFVHDGVHKNGLKTVEETIPICFADYLKSGASYANDILEKVAATNLSVEIIKKVTGLSEDDIERLRG